MIRESYNLTFNSSFRQLKDKTVLLYVLHMAHIMEIHMCLVSILVFHLLKFQFYFQRMKNDSV